MKDLMMVSYCHPSAPNVRYRQSFFSSIPVWAVDVRDEEPSEEELEIALLNLQRLHDSKFQ